MDYHVTHRHCELSSEEHEAAKKAAEHFQKFHGNILRVDAIFDGHLNATSMFSCEYTVHIQGHTIVAKDTADTFLKAIHEAAAKIERQLVKLKGRSEPARTTIRG
ncbi:MAG: ribosome-associated translation inhibitor RaiA [Candidatus Kapabacteria bacterium]|nr:ribosome-associated translation inhibitor RaiA [Candidatus Kapabacteria bacterium]